MLKVAELATSYGWGWFHQRPAMMAGDRWMTAVQGSMANGFPDLILIHRPAKLILFRELKVGKNKLRPDQVLWLEVLRDIGQDAAVWHDTPEEWTNVIIPTLARSKSSTSIR